MNDQTKEFRLGEEFFQNYRRAILTRVLPVMLLAGLAGLAIGRVGPDMPLGVTIVITGVVLVLMLLSTRRGYLQQVQRLRGFRILLSADGLQRTQPGLTDVFIQADQINRVLEYPGKSLMVCGPTPLKVIHIPATTEEFQKIRELVGAWHPVEVGASAPFSGQLPTLSGVASIGALMTVFMSENAVIVTALGVVLVVILGWALFSLRKNPNLDAKIKRSAWLVLLPMCAIAVRVWTMWAG